MKIVESGVIEQRSWGFDDEYLILQVQVSSTDFKKGDKVKVTIEVK